MIVSIDKKILLYVSRNVIPNRPYILVMRILPKTTIIAAENICPINFLFATKSTISSLAPNINVKQRAANTYFISLLANEKFANKQKAIINPPKIPMPPNVGITFECDFRWSSGTSYKCFIFATLMIDGIKKICKHKCRKKC